MVRSSIATTCLAAVALASSSNAFVPVAHMSSANRNIISARALHMSSITGDNFIENNTPASNSIDADVSLNAPAFAETKPRKNMQKKKKKRAAPAHKDGIFSPFVYAGKMLLGDDELNKIRAKAISMHSDVIKSFVETADTPVGQSVLKSLFEMSDKDSDGRLSRDELASAIRTLGFDWLKEKQIDGIIKRADADEDGYICLDEFCVEAPRTLKTNLVKLAKKNGGELGFLV